VLTHTHTHTNTHKHTHTYTHTHVQVVRKTRSAEAAKNLAKYCMQSKDFEVCVTYFTCIRVCVHVCVVCVCVRVCVVCVTYSASAHRVKEDLPVALWLGALTCAALCRIVLFLNACYPHTSRNGYATVKTTATYMKPRSHVGNRHR